MKKKYVIQYEASVYPTVEVEAESPEEAKELADDLDVADFNELPKSWRDFEFASEPSEPEEV